jgi:hypothetical protein
VSNSEVIWAPVEDFELRPLSHDYLEAAQQNERAISAQIRITVRPPGGLGELQFARSEYPQSWALPLSPGCVAAPDGEIADF